MPVPRTPMCELSQAPRGHLVKPSGITWSGLRGLCRRGYSLRPQAWVSMKHIGISFSSHPAPQDLVFSNEVSQAGSPENHLVKG